MASYPLSSLGHDSCLIIYIIACKEERANVQNIDT